MRRIIAPTFVYIIGFPTKEGFDWPVKVGITSNLNARLSSLQTGNYNRIAYMRTFRLPSRALALEIEKAFHDRYADLGMCGEWFGFCAKEALNGLCDIVYSTINRRVSPERRNEQYILSGAADALKELSKDWSAGQ